MNLKPLSPPDTLVLVNLWNTAFGAPFIMDAALWQYCTWGTPGFVGEDALIAWEGGAPVGLAVTKVWRLAPFQGMEPSLGFLSALVVHPDHQRQGLGSRLLAWAETRLREQGAQTLIVGRDMQPFFCGVPEATGALPFFLAHAYTQNYTPHDTQRDLVDYAAHPQAEATRQRLGTRLLMRPAIAEDVPAMLQFLDQEFPGRWRFEVGRFIERGGVPGDVILAWLDGAVCGFAKIHSPGTPNSAYGQNWRGALPQPAGGLGPIGVSQTVRGEGLGLALLDAGLRVLAERGTRGCIIDWTTLVDFYAKVGFKPWITYHQVSRLL